MIKYICVLCLVANAVFGAEARFFSSYALQSTDAGFGGFSSIHLDDSGEKFLATSDHAQFLSGAFKRQEGRIIGVLEQELLPIRDTKGRPINKLPVNNKPSKYALRDSEGIAVHPYGHFYISFESSHRIWAYRDKSTKAIRLPVHPDFKHLQRNSGLEALAIDQKGWLYALPERSGALDKPFPVYRYNQKTWDKKLSIPRRGPFLVVGADFGPDQKFYVLERDFKPPIGLATRIRRFTLTSTGFQNEETLLETSIGRHGNLEGISVWQDDQKRIRITLIADNNFKFFLRNMVVEYIVD